LRNEEIKLIHYPIVLVLFFLVLGSGLMLFVIPMFKSLYHPSWTRTFLAHKDAGEAQ